MPQTTAASLRACGRKKLQSLLVVAQNLCCRPGWLPPGRLPWCCASPGPPPVLWLLPIFFRCHAAVFISIILFITRKPFFRRAGCSSHPPLKGFFSDALSYRLFRRKGLLSSRGI